MKKTILTTVILAIFVQVAAAQECSSFKKLMHRGDKLFAEKQYNKAVDSYTAAMLDCPMYAAEARKEIVKVFNAVDKLKNEALLQKKKAEQANEKTKKVLTALLPKGVEKVYDYFLHKADSAFKIGEYEFALQNYKIAENAPDIRAKSGIEKKLSTTQNCNKWQKKALALIWEQKYQKAEIEILKVLKINLNAPKTVLIASAIDPAYSLIYVRGGTFLMGSEEGGSDEKPVHEVSLSSFEMSRYEVTNLQYAVFLNRYGSDKIKEGEFAGEKMIYEDNWGVFNDNGIWKPQANNDYYPVVYVTWYGANEYCKFYGMQLPTEAQWEYAAGGGNPQYVETLHATSLHNAAGGGNHAAGRTLYAGTDSISDLTDYAWYSKNATRTQAVGLLRPNSLSLYDMSGNVWEWCADWYDKNYYQITPKKNPLNIAKNSYKILRGGSWGNYANVCRVAIRGRNYPDLRNDDWGFRFVSLAH